MLALPYIIGGSFTLLNLCFLSYSVCPSAFSGLSKLNRSPPSTPLPPPNTISCSLLFHLCLLCLKCSPSLVYLSFSHSQPQYYFFLHHCTNLLFSALLMIPALWNSVDSLHFTSFLSITWHNWPHPSCPNPVLSSPPSLVLLSFSASSSLAGPLNVGLHHDSSQPLFSFHSTVTCQSFT